jgi:hypothetical protein
MGVVSVVSLCYRLLRPQRNFSVEPVFIFHRRRQKKGIPRGKKQSNHNPSAADGYNAAACNKGESSMKRTVMLTAALMFAGMTSLSLAHENLNSGKPAPSVESKPAASPAPAEAKPVANVESAKQPVTMNGKSETSPSKVETAAPQKVAQGSPAVTEKTDKKETSATVTPDSKEKKAEQKPSEAPTTTHPTK